MDPKPLKGNLHCHADESGPHKSGFPVEQVLKLFREEAYDLLGLTEHRLEAARTTYRKARQLKDGPPILIRGYELSHRRPRFHVASLYFPGRRNLKVCAHPVRTHGDKWLEEFTKLEGKLRIGAVELDNYLAFQPEWLESYRPVQARYPLVCDSDFHNDHFMMRNACTLYFAPERSPLGVWQAIQERGLLCIWPDLATWRLRFLAQNETARRWLDSAPEAAGLKMRPAVRPEAMSAGDIGGYFHQELHDLNNPPGAATLTPGFGGRLMSFTWHGQHLLSPLNSTWLDGPNGYAGSPTFESQFQAWQIESSAPDQATLSYRVRDGHWRGLVMKRQVKLDRTGLTVTGWQENPTGRAIETDLTLGLNLHKKFGVQSRAVIKTAAGEQEFNTPMRAIVKEPGPIFVPGLAEGIGLRIAIGGRRSHELHLWDNRHEMRVFVSFYFEPHTIPAGGRSEPSVLRLEPVTG
ncbi:MAG TPA: hypothetical protein PKN80_05065 [bacterium]|uniref:PHP domain protein n=1 Tax=candidate division TA06 bacterium ADurb.Bin417 TaxID=1852828 RepID=A0A1V5MK30_UNCT6|nr:MAG: hypothetical protein BWY73_00455 [candidate division TA06 bacterium ADurb.Bin417]HNQ35420.1 hypothetical protein [bacterium]HNS48637.1 hypothetical protein [bacterium]